MNNENNQPEFIGINWTKVFITIFAVVIVVLIAVVIVLVSIKMDGESAEHTTDNVPTESDEITDNGESGKPEVSTTPGTVVEASEIPELKYISTEESGENVILETTYCTLKYPKMFVEMIETEVYFGDGTGCIMVFAKLNNNSVPAFTILFNSNEGIDVGTLKLDGVDAPLRVSVNFHDSNAEGLSGGDLEGFYAVSEAFNDVVVSLAENPGFTSAN